MFNSGVKSEVSSFLEKAKIERDQRKDERKKQSAAIIIQKWYRGHCVRKSFLTSLRKEFDEFVGFQDGAEFTPVLRLAVEFQPILKNLHHKFDLSKDKKSFEYLLRYILQSFDSDDNKRSYLSLALRKDCLLKWISDTKWILLQTTLLLRELDPGSPSDSRLINVCLSVFVIMTNVSRWKVLKTEAAAVLLQGMNQMTVSVINYLVQKDLYKSLNLLLVHGVARDKPALSQITLNGILTIAMKPLVNSSYSNDIIATFILKILSVPGLVLHMNTMNNESFISLLNDRLCSRVIAYLYESPQNQKIIFNGLEGSYALCLIANLIQMSLLEIEVLADKGVEFSIVLSLLLDLLCAYVGRKKSNMTNWHPILGWFAQPTDKNLQAAMCHVTEQLHLLWSSKMLKLIMTPLYEMDILSKPLVGQESNGMPYASCSATVSKEKKKLFGGSSQSVSTKSLFKFVKMNHPGGHHSSDKRSLMPISKSVQAASMFYCFAAGSLKEIKNDILGGLSFGDLLPRMWRLIALFGSPRSWAKLIVQTGAGWELEPNECHLLHIFTLATGNLLIILDDVQLFEKQAVFTLEELLAMGEFFNEMIYQAIMLTESDPMQLIRQLVPNYECLLGGTAATTNPNSISIDSVLTQLIRSQNSSVAAQPSAEGSWQNRPTNKPLANNPTPALFAHCHRLVNILYERDNRRQYAPEGFWLIKDVKPSVFMADIHKKTYAKLISLLAPQIIPHKERVVLFRELVKADKASLGIHTRSSWLTEEGPIATMITVHRSRIVEDGYQQLAVLTPSQLKLKIRVRFVNEMGMDEMGIDLDGVFKEFLEETLRRVFDPSLNLFKVTSDQKLYPSPSSHIQESHLQLFEFLGRILAKAVYEGIVVDVPFANFFLTQMLGKEKTGGYSFIDELFTLDKELYKSLTYIKHSEADVSDLELTFSYDEDILGQIVTHDLVSSGRFVPVTNSNKISYVHRVAHFRMYEQIRAQSRAFIRGFYSIISPQWLYMFSAPELQKLISGDNIEIDIDDLRMYTRYSGGFHNNHKVTNWLWDILKNDFSPKEKALFLKFVTSCSKPPLLGFAHLEPPFSIRCVQYSNEDHDVGDTVGSVLKGFFSLGSKKEEVKRLPTASTCFNLLKLPNYTSRSTLKEKLRYAINSNAGFELS